MYNTYVESASRTYTILDVGKVIDCFAADLDGIGQSTGLRTRDNTVAVAADVRLMARAGYLSEVNIYLNDANGQSIRAAKYEVSTEGIDLTGSRPGNYLWPRTPGGSLGVCVSYNQAWRTLSETQRGAFKNGLGLTWGSVDVDTSFPMLNKSNDRNYVSNGYALKRSLFT